MQEPSPIEWRLHLKSSAEAAFDAWATDEGRERFWAERSVTTSSGFHLHFINGESLHVEVVEAASPSRIAFRYFAGSIVTVTLTPNADGGCDLCLREEGAPSAVADENRAGWVSVLLCFKSALEFGNDLRSHDRSRSWDQRYVDQ